MDEEKATFKIKLAKFLEDEGITDTEIQEDTGGECPTVASYIKNLADEYFGQKKDG
jgi:hypothetical protein